MPRAKEHALFSTTTHYSSSIICSSIKSAQAHCVHFALQRSVWSSSQMHYGICGLVSQPDLTQNPVLALSWMRFHWGCLEVVGHQRKVLLPRPTYPDLVSVSSVFCMEYDQGWTGRPWSQASAGRGSGTDGGEFSGEHLLKVRVTSWRSALQSSTGVGVRRGGFLLEDERGSTICSGLMDTELWKTVVWQGWFWHLAAQHEPRMSGWACPLSLGGSDGWAVRDSGY